MGRPNRLNTVTERIDPAETGFKSAIYVHCDWMLFHKQARAVSIRFSSKGKDGLGLDMLLTALGDSATSMIQESEE